MGPELDTFIAEHGVCGSSSPFRRPPRPQGKFPSYIHASAVKPVSAARSSRARDFVRETQ